MAITHGNSTREENRTIRQVRADPLRFFPPPAQYAECGFNLCLMWGNHAFLSNSPAFRLGIQKRRGIRRILLAAIFASCPGATVRTGVRRKSDTRTTDRDKTMRGMPWTGRPRNLGAVSESGRAISGVPRQAVESVQS